MKRRYYSDITITSGCASGSWVGNLLSHNKVQESSSETYLLTTITICVS